MEEKRMLNDQDLESVSGGIDTQKLMSCLQYYHTLDISNDHKKGLMKIVGVPFTEEEYLNKVIQYCNEHNLPTEEIKNKVKSLLS